MSKVIGEIAIMPPDRRRHYGAMVDLIGKAFSGYWNWQRNCHAYIETSSYDWQSSRIAMLGDEMVAHIGIWAYQMRVGVARLKTGGIGAVATSGKYRKLGVGRRLFTAINDSMLENGYDYSVLFGIENYYDKFNYASTWPDASTEFNVENLPQAPLTWRRRLGSANRLLSGEGELGKIYARDHAEMVGTAERGEHSIYTRKYHGWKLYEFLDARGKLQGYMAAEARDKRLIVLEMGGFDTPAKRLELLAQLRPLAQRNNCGGVLLLLGPDHPVSVLARRYKCRVTADYKYSGGAMGQLVNLPQALGKMTPELATRLARSPWANSYTGALIIQMGDQRATLHLKQGEVLVAGHGAKTSSRIVGGADIARLILGSEEPGAVIDAGNIRCTGKARELAETLFPYRAPMLCRPDYF